MTVFLLKLSRDLFTSSILGKNCGKKYSEIFPYKLEFKKTHFIVICSQTQFCNLPGKKCFKKLQVARHPTLRFLGRVNPIFANAHIYTIFFGKMGKMLIRLTLKIMLKLCQYL